MISLVGSTEDRFKAASSLTPLELRSAVRRRQYSGDILHADADLAITLIRDESRRMILHPVSGAVLELASALIDRQNIRALDAVQLSTAILANDTLAVGDQLQFVASDKRLLEAAEAEGLDIWDPTF